MHDKKTKQKSIYGVGVDICNIVRMYEKLSTHGDKFAEKILTNLEYSVYKDIDGREKQAQHLAKCWATKEAFVKALGCGFIENFMWSDITYFSPTGSLTGIKHPYIRLSERARHHRLMENKTVHLSVSDEVENAIAFVTIEEER